MGNRALMSVQGYAKVYNAFSVCFGKQFDKADI
jgi:hypothetical protein